MIDEQETEVTAAAAAQGLRVIDRRTSEDWVALVVEKR
jgi:ribosomal protein L11 methylase PrmA